MVDSFNPRTKQQAYVEYIEEATFGAGVAVDSEMQWMNSITKFTPDSKIKTETKMYLGDSTTVDRSMLWRHAKTGEEVGCSMEAMAQVGYLQPTMKYFFGGNTAAPTTVSDTLTSLSIVNIDTIGTGNCVHIYEGSVPIECTLNVPESGAISLNTKFIGKNLVDETLATYEGATMLNTAGVETHGSHAVDTDARVLQAEDINNIYMRLSETTPTAWGQATVIKDAVKELELKCVNKVGLPTDLNETTLTRIKGKVLNSRALTLGLTLTYADISATAEEQGFTLEAVRSLTPFDFRFDLDGYHYTLTGVQFPELKYAWGGEDMIGDKVTSLQIKGAKEGGVAVPPLKIEAIA